MSPGDLSLRSLQQQSRQSTFPTSHYHGITVTIDFSSVTEEMQTVLSLLCVDLSGIDRFSQKQNFCIVRANETVKHIFSELYIVQEPIKRGYIKVKVLELLLVLTALNLDNGKNGHAYFSKTQTDCVKKIRDFMVEHLSEHFTIEDLSRRFEISPTAMKSCFKEIYGTSVYSYLRTYRLQTAEKFLQEDILSVAEIAGLIGYENPNKFTSAFHAAYGLSPTAYKKECLNG